MSISSYRTFHEKNLGPLIFSFLSKKNQNNLAQTDTIWERAKLNFDFHNYKILKAVMKNKAVLSLKDINGIQQAKLLETLGKGGSKKAILLDNNRALLLPNMSTDSIEDILSRWKRMVHEELVMSEILTKLDLLSPQSRRVSISFLNDSKEEIPAYLSKTFKALSETQGLFIIDTKNPDSSTWKKGKDFLFKSMDDRLNENNWDYVLEQVLNDIVKICIHHLPISNDSINFAIVKNSSESLLSQYQVRYFGFDFSSKYRTLKILTPKERESLAPNMNLALKLVNTVLDKIFAFEFCTCEIKEEEKLNEFRDYLAQKYIKEIHSRSS